jgi:hypothetical protein
MLTYKINSTIFSGGTTASTINIPIKMEYLPVDNNELIETTFVQTGVNNSINPILDYEKVKFKPFSNDVTNTGLINQITYKISFLSGGTILPITHYSDIGFTDDDIKYERNYFLESYLYLAFYDSDNPLTQNLVNQIEIYCGLNNPNFKNKQYSITSDFLDSSSAQAIGYSVGHPKLASAIPIRMIVSNPLTVTNAFYEGYHIYYYKDVPSASLWMKASFFNAKTGKSTNLMTDNQPYPIDNLVNKLWTKYNLYKNQNGYYYEIDPTYSNNVDLSGFPNITVNLFEIQAL